MNGSPPLKFDKADAKKILTGAVIAGVGAAAATIATWTTSEHFDLRAAGVAFSAAFFAVVANAARKLMMGPKK